MNDIKIMESNLYTKEKIYGNADNPLLLGEEEKVFVKVSIDELKEIERNRDGETGFVYLLQYGNRIKIGCTKRPYSRIMNWINIANNYSDVGIGEIYISIPHYNYLRSEKAIHKFFDGKRIPKTELFKISMEEAVEYGSRNIEYGIKDKAADKERVELIKELLLDRPTLECQTVLTIPQATEIAKIIEEVYKKAGVNPKDIVRVIKSIYERAGLNLPLPPNF